MQHQSRTEFRSAYLPDATEEFTDSATSRMSIRRIAVGFFIVLSALVMGVFELEITPPALVGRRMDSVRCQAVD